MDSFEWLPTECADERYPMQLIAGELGCGEDTITQVPAGKIINNGWGEIGSIRDIGEPLKPVPDRLELAWYSYTEDELFEGTLELPHAELSALFRAGFEQPNVRGTGSWSNIVVGMGLGGWTSVWLAGGGLVREIAVAKFEPAPFEWSEVLDNPAIPRASYIRSTLQDRLTKPQLEAHIKQGPPVSTWPRYANRYRWRLAVAGLEVPLNVFLHSFNGERHFYDFARRPPGELDTAPKRMNIVWLTRSGTKIVTRVALAEQEVFDAFDALCTPAADADAPTLRIDLGPRRQLSITLESRTNRIALTRSSVDLRSLAG